MLKLALNTNRSINIFWLLLKLVVLVHFFPIKKMITGNKKELIDWLVFNTNFSSISAISWWIIRKYPFSSLIHILTVGFLLGNVSFFAYLKKGLNQFIDLPIVHYIIFRTKWIFPYYSPWYSWNTAKVGVKHQSINQFFLITCTVYNTWYNI
jgi:hypothetical protein